MSEHKDWPLPANNHQVGGEHYKSPYQHWDWVCNVGMSYLAAQVCKYLVRWRNKNGRQDVEKAAHFLDKLIEVSPIMLVYQNTRPLITSWVSDETVRFVEANDVQGPERVVCFLMAQWSTRRHLLDARAEVQKVLDSLGTDNEASQAGKAA